jgi:hypothetical protein
MAPDRSLSYRRARGAVTGPPLRWYWYSADWPWAPCSRPSWPRWSASSQTGSPNIVLVIFLPALLFEGSLKLRLRQLRENALPMLLPATIGVLAATLITGSAAHWFLGLPLLVALVFGAVTAATDPIFAKRIALRALTCRSSCRREESRPSGSKGVTRSITQRAHAHPFSPSLSLCLKPVLTCLAVAASWLWRLSDHAG